MNRHSRKAQGLLALVAAFSCGALFAAENSFTGGAGTTDWQTDGNWSLGRVPAADDAVVIEGQSVTLDVSASVDSLALANGAALTVGDKTTRGDATLTTTGDVTVSGGSTLTVYAGTLADYSVFATLETDLTPIYAALWNAAKIVTVGGNLTVEDAGSTVYPDADKVTGVPVVFKVAGDFTLGEGASFNAVERGWGWTVSSEIPANAKQNSGGVKPAWSFAPGGGRDYMVGGGYGGDTGGPGVWGSSNQKYGYSYGFALAPFLPGSNGGLYQKNNANLYDQTRGGGAVVVFTSGRATVNGRIDVSSTYRDHAGASGGGIWLVADAFTFGASASLDAHGGKTVNYGAQGVGGGGRIALAEGYSAADIATAATGVLPSGFVAADTIRTFEVATDVAPGVYTGSARTYNGHSGSLSYVRKASAPVRIVATIDGAGTVTLGANTYSESFDITVSPNEALTLTAAPAAGSIFHAWFSDVLPKGSYATPALTFTPTVPLELRVVFGTTAATSRTWTGTQSSDWFVGANWDPEGVPGPADDVAIAGKSVVASASAVVKSLTLSAAASLTVGDKTKRGDATLTTTGDMTVSGGSTLTVYAGTLADYSVFATLETDLTPIYAALWNAAKIVTVGGNLTVEDAGSTVYPDADKVTGVPVVFKVAGNFTLGAGASFNAVERGWGWTASSEIPANAKQNSGGVTPAWSFAPGGGRDYMVGGGYGGNTGGPGVWNKRKYGYSYGFALAPFLPGSNGGLYNQKEPANHDKTRGGGSVVVVAKGTATVDGRIDVSSTYHDHSGASGGGIWLVAEAFTFGASASLDAHGGMTKGYQASGLGGGGRIALAEGYSDEDLATAATGSVPEGFVDAGTIGSDIVSTDVAGGTYAGTDQRYYPNPGTLSYVRSSALPVNLHVTIEGPGSVAFGGTTYTSSFDVTVPVKLAQTLTAVADAGAQFVSWGGTVIPGNVCETAELTLTLEVPSEITVAFASGTVRRTWVGGREGNWSAPLGWSPIGVPRATDDVVISAGLVRTTGPLAVGSLTLTGSAVLSNAAVAVEGPSTLQNLSAGATVVAVAGALRLEDNARLIPANDPITGAPVHYTVGSLYLAAGAAIDASEQGWAWYESAEDPYATLMQGAYQTRAPGAGGDDSKAAAYNRGGAYGALGGNAQVPYGQPYGSAYAPLLPGSPNGLYNFLLSNMYRPGGTVWITAAGMLELAGTIAADGCPNCFYGAASGGGVWLCARGVKAAATASVSAQGGTLKNGSYASVASGGRIALALGLTDDQVAGLVDGTEPDVLGLTVQDGIDLFSASAAGGERSGMVPLCGNDGTVKTLVGPEAYMNVIVGGSPVAAVGAEPSYGAYAYEGGSVQTFTAPAYGTDPADSAVRYACAGYIVSNATEEVQRGSGCSVAVTIANGPMTVTWLWDAPQYRALVRKPAHGSLCVDGVTLAGDATDWTADRMTAVQAVPDEGYEFVCWAGKLPLGCATANPLAADLVKPLDVTPVFRLAEEPATRTWNGTGVWTDATKWTPAGNIPGAGDTVVIAGGTCTFSNALVAAALEVRGGVLNVGCVSPADNAEILVSGDAALSGGTVNVGAGPRFEVEGMSRRVRPSTRWCGHARLAVGGNLTLSGTANLAVMGGPVDASYSFASGCSFIEVAESLVLTDTSVLALYSEMISGGSVKVTAKSVTVGEQATVDACGKGFMWLNDATPPDAPGRGFSYNIGASHGGVGAVYGGGESSRPTYGFELAPVMPGSPNGSYSSGQVPGGGLIRLHADAVTVNGTLNADGFVENTYGGASGGGIWVTAKTLSFGPHAVLTAKGGSAAEMYASYGAGGRIAIGRNMDAEQLAALATTGTWRTFRPRKRLTLEAFRQLYANETMSVDVTWGGDSAEEPTARELASRGTFAYVDGTTQGFVLIVR